MFWFALVSACLCVQDNYSWNSMKRWRAGRYYFLIEVIVIPSAPENRYHKEKKVPLKIKPGDDVI